MYRLIDFPQQNIAKKLFPMKCVTGCNFALIIVTLDKIVVLIEGYNLVIVYGF